LGQCAGGDRGLSGTGGGRPGADRAIGLAGHGNGLYLLDKEGEPLLGIQSLDSRAAALAEPTWTGLPGR
jgi:L-xylulokinase